MSKILVVSDSHGDEQIIERLVKEYSGKVDLMFHTGDSEFTQENPLVEQFKIVVGNMDFGVNFPVNQTVDLPDARIFETHGHKYNVNFELTTLMLAGKEQHADIIIYGHTHQLMAVMDQRMLILNPGSISQPRGKYADIGGTYAIIEIEPTKYHIQFYNRDLQPVTDLEFNFSR